MSAKETPLFSGDIKPVRNGVYKRRCPGDLKSTIYFSRFENGEWFKTIPVVGFMTRKKAIEVASVSNSTSLFQDWPWCGLAEEQKCKKKSKGKR